MKNLLFFVWIGCFASVHASPKIIFLGDSLTDGYGVPREQAFPELIKQKLLKNGFPKVEVVNAGESGITSAGAASRMKWLLKGKPDLVVLSLGANDGLRGIPAKETEKNLARAIDIALKAKVKVILSGMKLPTNYGEPFRKAFEDVYVNLHKKFKDITLIPFLLQDVAGVKALNQADGIHPTKEGYDIIAKNIFPIILKKLS